MGFTESFLRNLHLQLKLSGLSARYTVAIVTYCVTKMITPCSPIIGHSFDIMIEAPTDKEWL